MAKGQAPIFEMYPSWSASVVAVGSSAVLRFFIAGDPVAKGRHRARVIAPKGGGRPFAQFYTPKETQDWEALVAERSLEQLRSIKFDADNDFRLPIKDGRIMAHLRFNLTKPVSYPKSVIHASKKPDLDNLVKSLLDGLVMGRIIEDDNCITDLQTMKRYASDAHPPGVEVELTCLPL